MRDELPIKHIPRDEFIERYWDYKPGQHVSFIGETGNGKTTLALQLLEATAHPELPALVLAMKPKDDTVDRYRDRMKAQDTPYRTVKSWPPTPSLWHPSKPHGYILQPKHTFDTDIDEQVHGEIFHRSILDSYKRGKRIIFADEAYSLGKELGLDRYLNTVWTKGRSMGCGLWAATQRPAWVPQNMYAQATHLFLDYPSDKRSRDRYREIGGVAYDVMERALLQASEVEFQWVYVRPDGRRSVICVVGA